MSRAEMRAIVSAVAASTMRTHPRDQSPCRGCVASVAGSDSSLVQAVDWAYENGMWCPVAFDVALSLAMSEPRRHP